MIGGKISYGTWLSLVSQYFILFTDPRLYIVKNMCMYTDTYIQTHVYGHIYKTYIYIYRHMYTDTHIQTRIYGHICTDTYIQTHKYRHISDCLQTVYGLPLLPNDTAGETFLYKSGAVRCVDWIFITWAAAWRLLGECVILGKTFYKVLFQQELVAATVTSTCFSLSHSSRWNLLEIK